MGSLILLLAVAAVLCDAAPIPKLTHKKFDHFGTEAGTKGVTCELTKPDKLRVVVSKEGTTGFRAHFVARPLVAQKVEGDFELTVRITHAPPEAKDLATVGRGESIGPVAMHNTNTQYEVTFDECVLKLLKKEEK